MIEKVIPTFLIVFVVMSGCSHRTPPQTEPVANQLKQRETVDTGMASWYGKEFNGRRTANGEVYDMFKLTAAHQTLPFNTIIEVENLENRRKTLVRINDRGPFVKDRIIDLSLKAAKMLDMEVTGTAQVALRKIKTDELSPDQHVYETGRGFWIQAGAFARPENAQRMRQKMNEAFASIRFEIRSQNGYYKVISEKISTRSEAEKWLRLLDEQGIDGFIKDFE